MSSEMNPELARMLSPIERRTELCREAFLEEFHGQRPVVMQGRALKWPAVQSWSLDHLSHQGRHARVLVRQYLPDSDETFIAQCQKQCKRVRLRDFLAYIAATGCADLLPGEPWTWALRESQELFSEQPWIADELHFSDVLTGESYDCYLWVGAAGYVTGLHVDLCDVNMLAQVVGRKEAIVFSPEQTPNLYSHTTNEAIDGGYYSSVNSYAPDLEKHPKYGQAEGLRTTLIPGDILYVPNGWWHSMRALEPCVSVNAVIA